MPAGSRLSARTSATDAASASRSSFQTTRRRGARVDVQRKPWASTRSPASSRKMLPGGLAVPTTSPAASNSTRTVPPPTATQRWSRAHPPPARRDPGVAGLRCTLLDDAHEVALGAELVDGGRLPVQCVEPTGRVDGQVDEIAEAACPRASGGAELAQEMTLLVENLDPIVAAVRHIDAPRRADHHGAGPVEFERRALLRAERGFVDRQGVQRGRGKGYRRGNRQGSTATGALAEIGA